MGKRYDATTKHLIERHPRDWLALAGLPLPEQGGVAIVDAELSSITTASDAGAAPSRSIAAGSK